MPAEPSLGFLQRYFGPSFMIKKRKTDIQLPNEEEEQKKKKKKRPFDIEEGSTIDKMLKGYKKVSELSNANK